MGIHTKEAFEVGEKFPCEHNKDQNIVRRLFQSDPVYAAMVWNLDQNVGKVLDTLEKEGLADTTAVFFTSDNGGLSSAGPSPTSNAPLNEGKGWMYEGGVREPPLIVKLPGMIEEGSQCSIPVSSPDFYPTILELAGAKLMPDQHKDGVSILPLLKGEGDFKRPGEAIYWHYPHYGDNGGRPGASMRMGDYKLIEFFEDSRLELYNLVEDISEEEDLSKALPDLTDKMHKMLIKWQDEVDALCLWRILITVRTKQRDIIIYHKKETRVL